MSEIEKKWRVRVRYTNTDYVTDIYFGSEEAYEEFKIECTELNYDKPVLVGNIVINLRYVTTIEFCGEVVNG